MKVKGTKGGQSPRCAQAPEPKHLPRTHALSTKGKSCNWENHLFSPPRTPGQITRRAAVLMALGRTPAEAPFSLSEKLKVRCVGPGERVFVCGPHPFRRGKLPDRRKGRALSAKGLSLGQKAERPDIAVSSSYPPREFLGGSAAVFSPPEENNDVGPAVVGWSCFLEENGSYFHTRPSGAPE